MNLEDHLIFSTKSYDKWASRLAELSGLECGEIKRKDFPDGEHYQRLLNRVDGRNVILVSGTINDRETLELFDLANAIVDGGASSLKILLPYYGYSTMERAVKKGEAVKAKYRARLLSNGIPRAPMGNRFYMLDLHSEGLPQYFENGVQTIHVYAKPVVFKASQELADRFKKNQNSDAENPDFVLASTDAGRMKWVESLARDLGIAPAFAYKKRLDDSTTLTLGVSGPVEGKFVVIYDDMIRTGSSLINAARAYMQAGASAVAAIATHAVLPADSLEKLQNTGLFKQIVVTDSHPRALELESAFLKVESSAELFLNYLSDTIDNSKISKEFEHAKA